MNLERDKSLVNDALEKLKALPQLEIRTLSFRFFDDKEHRRYATVNVTLKSSFIVSEKEETDKWGLSKG